MKKEDILRKGSVEVHAKVSGIRQRHLLKVVREKTVWGMVPYLVGEYRIPAAELIRLAEELQLPIKCAGMTVFPKGKAAQDFAEKEEKKKDPKTVRKKGLSHDKIVKEEDEEEGSEEDEKSEEKEEDEGEKKTMPSEESETISSEEKKAVPEEKEEVAMKPVEAVLGEAEKTIELEKAGTIAEKTDGQNPQADNPVAKENGPKEKKRTFCEGVLSEGILR